MIARRLTGLLLGLLMAHLTLVGADVACSTHSAQSGASNQHAAMTAHHDRMSMAPHAGAASATKQPCETPSQPECCRAMTSCAVSATFERATRVATAPEVHGAIESANRRTPLSQITPPEPPPPKA